MSPPHSPGRRLGPLRERLVFLGGAVTEFFITRPGGPGPRQTKDVDVVIDVVNLGEYSETLREQLVALGFRKTPAKVRPSVAGSSTTSSWTSCPRVESSSASRLRTAPLLCEVGKPGLWGGFIQALSVSDGIPR
jgi:hypothetical protein